MSDIRLVTKGEAEISLAKARDRKAKATMAAKLANEELVNSIMDESDAIDVLLLAIAFGAK